MQIRPPEGDVALRPVRTGAAPEDQFTGWIAVAVVLLVWEGLCRWFEVSSLYLPRPSQITVALYELFAHKEAAKDLAVTLYRIFGGFSIGLAFGVAIGLAMVLVTTALTCRVAPLETTTEPVAGIAFG
jgi:ABC-type nitrate/sulfonate/bicarbonate transport system permease component